MTAGLPERPWLLLFDLDGTLIDSREDLCTAVNLMRRDYDLPPLAVERVAAYVGDGLRKLVERGLQGHPTDLDAAVKACAAHYRNHLVDRTVLYPGVADGLPRLCAAGHRLELISNKPGDSCRLILEHFGVASFFRLVLGGGDTPRLKPDPEPLLLAMTRCGIPPARTWMIGDHHTDLEAARRAGVKSVYLADGIGDSAGEKPDFEFDSFTAMTNFFLSTSSG